MRRAMDREIVKFCTNNIIISSKHFCTVSYLFHGKEERKILQQLNPKTKLFHYVTCSPSPTTGQRVHACIHKQEDQKVSSEVCRLILNLLILRIRVFHAHWKQKSSIT
jgi:hypothetical protein